MRLSDIKNVLTKLKEAALETKDIETLWDENGADAAEYSGVATYLVRAIPKSTPTEYETFSVQGASKKPFGKFTADQLDQVLAPIRPDQTPDAEGYTTYVDLAKTSAFEYTGDPIIVTIGEDETQLNTGDYVTRVVKGKSFKYGVEKKADFESQLKKV